MARVETAAVPKLTSHELTTHNKVKLAVKIIIPNNKIIDLHYTASLT